MPTGRWRVLLLYLPHDIFLNSAGLRHGSVNIIAGLLFFAAWHAWDVLMGSFYIAPSRT